VGGIYSVEQGREIIGFSSSQLPLTKYHAAFAEDTESQYADELRRQAYIQTLGRPSSFLSLLSNSDRNQCWGIRDILVRIQLRIRLLSSMTLRM
jgi:hypothetical protein